MGSSAVAWNDVANPTDTAGWKDVANPSDAKTAPSLGSDLMKYSPVGMVKGLADTLGSIAHHVADATSSSKDAGSLMPAVALAKGVGGTATDMATANEQLLEKAKASYAKGDYGEAAFHFLGYLVPGGQIMDDVGEDVRNGNYAHAAAKMVGLASSAAIPKILPAAGAVADAASSAAGKIKAALPDSIPVVPGAVADAVGIVHPGFASSVRLYNRVAKVGNAVVDAAAEPASPAPAVSPILTGEDLARQQRLLAFRAADREARVDAVRASLAPEAAAVAPAAPAAAAERWVDVPHPGLGYDSEAQAYRELAEQQQNAPAPVIPEPVTPQPVALDPARAAQQRIEDAADQQAAHMRAQAEDIEWANRAHRADRFAAYLLREGIEPTPVNLARAAKEMAEKGGAPSDETVDMIHDRMNYHPRAAEDATRSRLVDTLTPPEPAAAPAADPPSALQRQLQESIDALKTAKASAIPKKAPVRIRRPIRSIGALGKLN